MFRSTSEYFEHIRDEIAFLQAHIPQMTKDQLLADEVLKRAVIRSIEIIGEAIKQIPDTIKARYPMENSNVRRTSPRENYHEPRPLQGLV